MRHSKIVCALIGIETSTLRLTNVSLISNITHCIKLSSKNLHVYIQGHCKFTVASRAVNRKALCGNCSLEREVQVDIARGLIPVQYR
jgi:hypothetical protein